MTGRFARIFIVGAVAAGVAVGMASAFAQDSFGQAPVPSTSIPQQAPMQASPQQTPAQPSPQQAPAQPSPQQAPILQGAAQALPQQGPMQTSPQQVPMQPPTQQLAPLGAADGDALTQAERVDFGVPPTARLHAGQMHGPTPVSIPGGQVITTRGLVDLMRNGQAPVLLLDVLGGPEVIPGSQYAVPASQPGSFDDFAQQELGQYLQQATGGNRQHPIVTYCLSTQCWMSYNAALRAINLGYTNVLWYRGGIEAWQQAGMPTQRVR